MSPAGQVLHDRFETVCRSELRRLRKKTASLAAAERETVDALVLEVARSLAMTLDAAVQASDRSGIALVVLGLFTVAPPFEEKNT
jgi:hypothetical protein